MRQDFNNLSDIDFEIFWLVILLLSYFKFAFPLNHIKNLFGIIMFMERGSFIFIKDNHKYFGAG